MSSKHPACAERACAEKVRLVASYGAAVGAYYSAVCELEQGMITGSEEIYQNHRNSTERAREMCEAARKELDDHVSHHGC